MNARLWPDTKAVIVIELDPDHLPEAIGDLQRFLSAHRLNAPEDQMLYGPTLHIAIEDVAEAVLKHFEQRTPQTDGGATVPAESVEVPVLPLTAPSSDTSAPLWPPPPDVRTSVCAQCSTNIFWQDCPTGGWWIHHRHPADGHDALPDLETPIATLVARSES